MKRVSKQNIGGNEMVENIVISEVFKRAIQKLKQKGRRKLRLFSKRKFKRNMKRAVIALAVLAIFFTGKNLMNNINVSGNMFVSEPSYSVDIPEKYKVVEVTVYEGSSAWAIQNTLVNPEDMNDVMIILEKLNDRDMSKISAGETLMFLAPNNKEG